MERQYFIAGNWKMNNDLDQSLRLTEHIVAELKGKTTNRLAIAPNFTALEKTAALAENSPIEIAAQNVAADASGAHTGEVSVSMLKSVGVAIVIIGHSERRAIYRESESLINQKVRLAVSSGMEVILCIGETLEQREAEQTEAVIDRQLTDGLSGIAEDQIKQITLAYEPVWAIGTGKTAAPQQAQQVHKFIRERVAQLYSAKQAESVIIQYGGSVKPENVKQLMAMPDIDGALVGGASLKCESFCQIALFNS